MIVNQVYIGGDAFIPSEYQPPIAAYRKAPKSLEIAFQGMQPPARNAFKLSQFLRRVDRGQHPAQPWRHVGPQQLAVTSLEEAPQTLVANGSNHGLCVALQATNVKCICGVLNGIGSGGEAIAIGDARGLAPGIIGGGGNEEVRLGGRGGVGIVDGGIQCHLGTNAMTS